MGKKAGPHADLADRNDEILRQVARRRPKALIAKEFDLSVRHIDTIVDQWRANRKQLSKQDPVVIVEDMLAEYQAIMDDLGEIAYTATHDSVRVGALRTRTQVMSDMKDLMQETGTLPRDLGQLRVQLELAVIAERFMVVLDEFSVQSEVVDGLMAALRPDLAALPPGANEG